MRWALPRSLTAQIAVLIAIALFAAQAINLAMLLRDRQAFRLGQATRPVATRLADALEREAQGSRAITADRGRIRRLAADPIPAAAVRQPEVADELRRQLAELGIAVGRIDTRLLPPDEPRPAEGRPDQARPDQVRPDQAHRPTTRRRGDRTAGAVLIAVEQPGRGWLVIAAPWPRAGARLLIAVLIQTLILYLVVLLPVLWIVRRMAEPLRGLTRAAATFDPHVAPTPIPRAGPADLRQLIAAFNALRLRVVAMVEEKDRMLGAIGHDLRTPLAALRVRIESVEDDTDRERMADTVTQMSRTLEDILSLARVGHASETATDVDLAALVDAVADDFRDLEEPVTFVATERLTIRLRPNPMRRAVRNLIENAIKYGGEADVRVERRPDAALIVVADKGPGIPAEALDKVFQPFTRLEGSRNRDTGGTGLGLALARAIAREAGGDIMLANRPQGGLEATILLPR